MAGDAGFNMPRFYVKAAIVVCIMAIAASLRFPRDAVTGVLAGGALSIINLREMHKGLRVMLRMERPSARRLFFSGIFRLLILTSVIILIASMKLVNLLGLLIGFAVVPVLIAMEGLFYARRMQALEDREAPLCNQKPRQNL